MLTWGFDPGNHEGPPRIPLHAQVPAITGANCSPKGGISIAQGVSPANPKATPAQNSHAILFQRDPLVDQGVPSHSRETHRGDGNAVGPEAASAAARPQAEGAVGSGLAATMRVAWLRCIPRSESVPQLPRTPSGSGSSDLGSPPLFKSGQAEVCVDRNRATLPAHSAGGILGSEAHHESTGGKQQNSRRFGALQRFSGGRYRSTDPPWHGDCSPEFCRRLPASNVGVQTKRKPALSTGAGFQDSISGMSFAGIRRDQMFRDADGRNRDQPSPSRACRRSPALELE